MEEARADYAESYATTHVWYRLGVKHFTRESGEEFYAVFIDNTVVFGINDHISRGVLEGVELLEWAISEAEEFVERVRDGTYRETILLLCQYFAQTKMSKNRTKGERAGQAGQLEGMCSILRQRSP